jgi:polyphenol oxidase
VTSEPPGIIPVLENAPGIRAFFTTRRGGVSGGIFTSLNLGYFSGDDPAKVRQNWDLLLNSQGLKGKTPVIPRLCHGDKAAEISGREKATLEGTDAVFTREENWVLAVTMGDCLAALIADPETRCVAAVHAGWRGSRDNILGKTLTRLFNGGCCRPESTWIAFGPCLSTPALEISAEVAQTLPIAHVHRQANHFFFDLRSCNRAQAEAAGALSGHITEMKACTRTDGDRFFSHRRDGAVSGRMAACIALI